MTTSGDLPNAECFMYAGPNESLRQVNIVDICMCHLDIPTTRETLKIFCHLVIAGLPSGLHGGRTACEGR